MNIALIGYGKMNQEIETITAQSGIHNIVSISDKIRTDGLDMEGLKYADVAIDFTAPDAVLRTVDEVTKLRLPLVIGTTGWYDGIDEVTALVRQRQTGVIYGHNFSIGANIFFALTSYAAGLVSEFDGYDVFGIETHHTGKKDSPSGTARKLADTILSTYPRKKTIQTETLQRKINEDELHFVSVRGGRNFGRHEIVFDSHADEIRLLHQAWGRQGFAEGAILAADFIKDRKGMYDFSDVFLKKYIKKGGL